MALTWTKITTGISSAGSTLIWVNSRNRVEAIGPGIFDGKIGYWTGSAWNLVTPATIIPDRINNYFGYDVANDKFITLGGYDEVAPYDYWQQDTWQYDGSIWTQLFPTHTPDPTWEYPGYPGSAQPPGGYGNFVWDERNDYLLMYGWGSIGAFSDETYKWDGSDWIKLFPATSPPMLGSPQMVFDIARNEVVLHGGYISAFEAVNPHTWDPGTYTWNGTNWTIKSPAHSPTANRISRIAYDPVLQKIVAVYEGAVSSGDTETWTWDGTDWTEETIANVPQSRPYGMIYDYANGYTMMINYYGTWKLEGYSAPPPPPPPPPSTAMVMLNEVKFRSYQEL